MNRSALLLLDVQHGLVESVESVREQSAVFDRIGEAVRHARAAGWLIVAVTVGFRNGYPEVAPSNRFFVPVARTGRFIEGSEDLESYAPAVPGGADVTVRKHRQDAFFGTDLDMILRAQDVRRVALTGFTTSGGVLTSFKAACDRDYEVTVLRDACADREPRLHEVVVQDIFAAEATALTVAEWINAAPRS